VGQFGFVVEELLIVEVNGVVFLDLGVREVFLGVDRDGLEGVEGAIEGTVPTAPLQLIIILPIAHAQILDLGHIVFDLLAFLLMHLEVEAPVVQTLPEILLQGLLPQRLERVLLIQHLLVVGLQSVIDDRNGLGGVGREELEDLLA